MATLTINTTAAQDVRIIAAFRATTANPDATGADVKRWLINHLKGLVREHERQVKIQAAVAEVTDIEPS